MVDVGSVPFGQNCPQTVSTTNVDSSLTTSSKAPETAATTVMHYRILEFYFRIFWENIREI